MVLLGKRACDPHGCTRIRRRTVDEKKETTTKEHDLQAIVLPRRGATFHEKYARALDAMRLT